MPDSCGNRLTIRGTKEDREKFLHDVKTEDSDFDFNVIVPKPSNIECYISKSYPLLIGASIMGGYFGWCYDNWGSKWSAYEVEIKSDDEKTVMVFLTAWSPPNNFFMDRLSNKYPSLQFELQYACVDYYGFWKKEDGVIKSDKQKLKEGDYVVNIEKGEADENGDYEEEETITYSNRLKEYEDLFKISG